jgi:hypothetical protein
MHVCKKKNFKMYTLEKQRKDLFSISDHSHTMCMGRNAQEKMYGTLWGFPISALDVSDNIPWAISVKAPAGY